jgi:hypothetical protein
LPICGGPATRAKVEANLHHIAKHRIGISSGLVRGKTETNCYRGNCSKTLGGRKKVIKHNHYVPFVTKFK